MSLQYRYDIKMSTGIKLLLLSAGIQNKTCNNFSRFNKTSMIFKKTKKSEEMLNALTKNVKNVNKIQ